MSLKRVWVNFPIDEAPLAPEARSADMLSAVGAATFCRPHRLRTECPPAVSLQNACAPTLRTTARTASPGFSVDSVVLRISVVKPLEFTERCPLTIKVIPKTYSGGQNEEENPCSQLSTLNSQLLATRPSFCPDHLWGGDRGSHTLSMLGGASSGSQKPRGGREIDVREACTIPAGLHLRDDVTDWIFSLVPHQSVALSGTCWSLTVSEHSR